MYPVNGTVTGAGAFLSGQHVYIEKGDSAVEGAADGPDGPAAGGIKGIGDTGSENRSDGETDGTEEAEIILPEGYVEDVSGKPWVWATGGGREA